jgi:iron complex outermembrane receptor protein
MTPIKKFPLVSLFALSMAMPAFAQTPAPAPQTAPPANDQASDVIVVTANKREETVQDVAVAVTAVTSEMREEQGINTVTDLTNVTPGLSYTAANERVFLRGIGRNTNNFGADPGVANYTDGVYQAFATIAGRDNIFTDRIEVLRGPQGTLYGRNSIGGALNIVSKRPTDDFQGEFRMAAGDYEEMKIATSLSGPITDWLRYRVVGYDEARPEGVHQNFGTNSTEGYEVNNWNLEGQLEMDLGENLSAWFKYTTGRYTMSGPPGGRVSTFSTAPYLKPFGSGATYNPAFIDGGVLPQGTYAFSGDASVISYTQDGNYKENPYFNGIKAFNSSREGTADLDAYNDYAAEITWSSPWGFDVKYVGGYIFYDYHLYGDNDDNPVRSITYNAITNVLTTGPCTGVPFVVNLPRTTLSNGPAAGCVLASAPLTIYPNWSSHYNESRSFFSNEVNLISTSDGPLQWIGGLYAYQENSDQPVETYLYDDPGANTRAIPTTTLTLANPNNRLTYTNNSGYFNAYGIYGQVDYQLNDQLKLTGGLRYSYDWKQITETAELNCYIICASTTGRTNRIVDITPGVWNGVRMITNPANPAGPLIADPRPQPGVASATLANPTGVTYNALTGLATRELQDDWDAVTGTAGVEWTPSNDTLVFAKYSRGYKSGGFNATSMNPFPRTKKEIVDAYEAGWKQEWDGLNLTTNSALFYYDYKDAQVPLTVVSGTPGAVGSTTFTSFENLPKVETVGYELESTWRPIDDLTIRFTYAYLNAEVKESGIYVDALQPSTAPLTVRQRDVEGNKLPQSPQNKVAVNVAYNINFEDGSSLLPSISWYWRDSFYSSIFNNPEQLTPDFQQTDARLIWNDADGHFTIIGAIRNAFDEQGYDQVGAFLRTGTATKYQTPTFTPPRMATVEVQFHF